MIKIDWKQGADGVLEALARIPPLAWWRSALVGAGCAGAVLLIRWAASGLYPHITGFMILLPGVIVAALAAGRVGGLSATATALLGGWIIAGPGAAGAGLDTALGRIATANFLIVGLFCTLVAASLRNTLRRLSASLADLSAAGAGVRAAEQTLQDRESLLQAMFDQASAGIARVSLEGRIVSSNARLAEILGLPIEKVIGLTTEDVTHPDDVELTRRALQSGRDGRPGQIEKRYVRPDGAIVWALTSLRALAAPSGELLGHIAVIVDITAAKAAEAALRESEARFRLMADTAPSPVWMTNADAEVEFVNAALVRFYGRPAEEILGHAWRQSVHPDDQAPVRAAMEEARPARRPYAFEARFQRADGVWRWMRIAVNPRFGAHGAFLGYVGMSFDITETREALDALAAQERRQTFLLRLTDRLRDLTTPESIMRAVEEALGAELGADRVGYGEVDLQRGLVSMTRDWTSGVASAQGAFALEDFGPALIQDLAAGRFIRIPDVREDPRTRDSLDTFSRLETTALMRAPLIRAGQLHAFLYAHSATVRQWSDADAELLQEVAARTWSEIERTRAEAEVRESEERFRAIADTAPVLIWVTQQDRTRAFVNQAYVAFNGGSYEEARLADWRAVIHPDDHERIIHESLAGEATGQPFSMEARYLRHDGAYRWLKSFSRPRLGADGEVIGFVGVAFDVTDIRDSQARLQQLNDLLEERVGEALAEKAKAEADLMHAQRMEAVGRLTGGVAHDFNNLLTVVIGALDMMLKSPDNAARQKKLGEAALSAARRGERLTHQLLAFSRRQALRPESTDANALIRESEPLLRRALGEAIEFELKLRRGGARVSVDPAQFEAALLNLVVNARDALGDRGKVSIQTRVVTAAEGEIPELPAGSYVRISVTDDGAGMSPEVIARVFEPFYTTKPVGKGTGLGLSQVYGFARQSGGGVQVRSRPGAGTEIRLYLPPLAETEALEPARTAAAARPMAAGRRLLLVEDDPSVAAVARELLEGLGLEVRSADSGPHALEILRAERFDLMMTDVVMPGGMTGIELARESARSWPEMRIVLTSGYAGEDVDTALADAPWPFVRKPYSGEQLAEVLGDLPAGETA